MDDVKLKKARSIEQVQIHQSEDIRKGPWSLEEDTILANYVATHGDGHWNSVARCAGLKRSGKSCRLRWLNYLRPDVRRGNITLQEQITILDLHSRWGNRWSKIARHLPGRTDNEIKNYWRTRVMKLARNLKCDVDSKQFKDALRYVWMPRLIERVQLPPSAHMSFSELDPNPIAPALVQTPLHGAELQVCLDSQELGYNVSDQIFEQGNTTTLGGGDLMESLWDDENIWLMRQLCHDLEIKENFLA